MVFDRNVSRYDYGHDYGNWTTAGFARFQEKTIGSNIFLSLAAPYSEEKQRLTDATSLQHPGSVRVHNPGSGPFDTREHVLSIAGEQYLIGHSGLALAQTIDGSGSVGDISRYWTKHRNLRALLTCSGTIIPDKEYALRVVTHLPAGPTYSEENIAAVMDSLNGSYDFILDSLQRRAHIEVARVLKEGAGMMMAYGKNDSEAIQASINIGWYSTDPFVTTGMRPHPDQCKSLPVGVSKIGEVLQERVEKYYPGYRFSPANLHRILLASTGPAQLGGVPIYPEIYRNGKPFSGDDLHHWVLEGRQAALKEIEPFISRTLKSGEGGAVAADYARVLLGGGGSYHFYSALKQMIEHLEKPEDPALADACGFAFFAEAIGRRAAKQSA